MAGATSFKRGPEVFGTAKSSWGEQRTSEGVQNFIWQQHCGGHRANQQMILDPIFSPMGTSTPCNVYMRVILAMSGLALRFLVTTANDVNSNFHIGSGEFNCATNMKCNDPAHTTDFLADSKGPVAGTLSLILEDSNLTLTRFQAGSAFYKEPVIMRDSGKALSFNTSFVFSQRSNATTIEKAGDGMAFILVEDYLEGQPPETRNEGKYLACFGSNGTNSYKSVVVEFDNYYNPPVLDPGWNHVSIDVQNITNIKSYGNATSLGIQMWNNNLVYVWIEYRQEDYAMEVRISSDTSRPAQAFFAYTGANLYDGFTDKMWVGFSASTGGETSYYYVGNWTFSAYAGGTSESSGSDSDFPVGAIVGIVVGVLVLLLVILGLVCVCRRRRFRSRLAHFPWKRSPRRRYQSDAIPADEEPQQPDVVL